MGKSLLDVQRELRIKAAYIAAIENADLTVFPNHGFVAGYVRSYARYLGLDAEDVFARFCAESGFQGINAEMKSKPVRSGGVLRPAQGLENDPLSRARPVAAAGSGFSLGASLSGLGSLAVLCAVIGGIGYGGYAVLQELQRVEIAPVAQTPSVDDMSAEGFASVAALTVEEDNLPFAERTIALEALYAPRPAEPMPLIAPRDGPIGTIDPESVGTFVRATRMAPAPTETDRIDETVAAAEDEPTIAPVPEGPPAVSVVATDRAWIRVTLADGTSVFEKILEPGEVYTLPDGMDGPQLRAGNSGSVYLRVGENMFGPLGTGTRVAKDVSLLADDIRLNWDETEATLIVPLDQPVTAQITGE
jgi:cytoskeleton protein RodZ